MFIIETFGRLQFFAKIKWSLFYFCNQRSMLLSKKIMRYRHKITAVKHGSYDIRLQWLVASYRPQPHPNHCFVVHHSPCLIMCCVIGQLLGVGTLRALVSSRSPPPRVTRAWAAWWQHAGGWASLAARRPQSKPGRPAGRFRECTPSSHLDLACRVHAHAAIHLESCDQNYLLSPSAMTDFEH